MEKAKTAALILLIALIYAATIPLNSFFKAHFVDRQKGPDIIQNIFGGLRETVGDLAFMKAEEYHHRGLPFMQALAYHGGESTLMAERHGGKEEEHHHAKVRIKKDLFSGIYRSVKVTEDTHLLPSEEKEVLPWFYVEIKLNPRDIRGYVLGGYWLTRMGRYDESLKFLEEGEKNNPGSAQILTSIAKVYYHQNKYQEAIQYLERARALWLEGKGINAVSNQYIENDRMLAFDLLGYLYENEGQYEKALEVYNEFLSFGKNRIIEEKIIKLKETKKAIQ